MKDDKNEIDKLIDNMIQNGDDFLENLTPHLPKSLAESISMFNDSHKKNLKKIKAFLNK
jgi:hypothetical protein